MSVHLLLFICTFLPFPSEAYIRHTPLTETAGVSSIKAPNAQTMLFDTASDDMYVGFRNTVMKLNKKIIFSSTVRYKIFAS